MQPQSTPRGASRRPLLAAALAAGLLGAACTGGATATSGGGPAETPSSSPSGPALGSTGSGGTRAALLPESATALPEFDLATFNRLLSQLKGRPVVVNIWASWCGPCNAEAPDLAKVSAAYAGRVQFLGVDIQDRPPAARSFVARYGWTYPSVFDPSGAIRDGLGLLGQPVTLLYDRSGAKVFTWSGAIGEAQLRGEIDKVL